MGEPSAPVVDALIVGAGPTGLTLAIDLVRRGLDVRIVERSPGEFEGSRAKGVMPRTLEVFHDLGVIGDILEKGTYPPTFGLHVGRVNVSLRVVRPKDATADVPHPNIWLIPQSSTNQALHARLRALGGRIEFGRELIGFTQDEEAVSASVAGPAGIEHVTARYLVGADGGSSSVRKQLGIDFVGSTDESDRMAIVDATTTGLSHDRWHVWVRPRRSPVLTAWPLPGSDQFQWVFRLTPGEEPALDRDALGKRIRAHTRDRRIELGDIRWATVFRPNVRLAEHFRRGRVFIGGDAAHVHTPAGGQGLNTGIQDAYNLGWKLAQVLAGADGALLDTYEAERRPIALGVLGLSNDKYRGMSRLKPSSFRRGHEVKQLSLSYHGGPLAPALSDRTAKLRVGDRAPDAPLTTRDGTSTRLHDVLAGPQFTAIAYGPAAADALDQLGWPSRGARLRRTIVGASSDRADVDLVDADGTFREVYGLSGDTLLLVRPDGYLGHVATSGFHDSARAAARVMTPPAGTSASPAANRR